MKRGMVTVRLTVAQARSVSIWLDSALSGADPSPSTRKVARSLKAIDAALLAVHEEATP